MIEILNIQDEIMHGRYDVLAKLPDGATNGDVIKAMFPNAKVNNTKYSYVVEVKLPYHSKYDTGLLFDKDWWNTPYEKGGRINE